LPKRPDLSGSLTLLATSGGVAAGPVLGGMLSLVGSPIHTPFAVWAILLATLIPAIWFAAPHVECRPLAPTPPPVGTAPAPAPVHQADTFTIGLAAAVGFTSFALFGFSLSLAPALFGTLFETE